jgi:hypothetical protein
MTSARAMKRESKRRARDGSSFGTETRQRVWCRRLSTSCLSACEPTLNMTLRPRISAKMQPTAQTSTGEP